MPEGISGEKLKRAVKTTVIGGIALLSASCGATTNEANKSKYVDCSTKYTDAYGKSGEAIAPSLVISDLIPKANEDLKLLRDRAKLIGGNINIAPAKGVLTLENSEPEIYTYKSGDVRLKFSSNDIVQVAEKDVLFPSEGEAGNFKIAPGSLACTVNQQVYRNRVFESIVDYEAATRNLR